MTAEDRGVATPQAPTWRDHAACRGADLELFFPLPADKAGKAQALTICHSPCPVRADCLADALDAREVEFGIRGGKTPEERRALLKLRPDERPQPADEPKRVWCSRTGKELKPCGTEAAYRRHKARGERCDVCLAAARKAQNERDRQREASNV